MTSRPMPLADALRLSERCTYWLRGQQCPALRVPGSTRCALHDAGKRHRVKP